MTKRVRRNPSYLKRRRVENRRFMLFALLVLIISLIAYLFINSSLNRKIKILDNDIISSKKKLEEVNKEIDQLKEDYEMRNTDQFKEKVARERLGMVKDEKKAEENQEINKQTNKDKEANEQVLPQSQQASPQKSPDTQNTNTTENTNNNDNNR